MENNYDVIIVGAGPVGLTLALALGISGVTVLVLEKKEQPSPHSRAPGIWPATLELLADLGVVRQFLDRGIVIEEFTVRNAANDKKIISLPLTELSTETAFPQFLVLPQNVTEEILLDNLKLYPTVEIKMSAEVQVISQSEDEVEIQYKKNEVVCSARSKFAAGCDGARSIIRKSLNLQLEGITYDIVAALVDVKLRGRTDYPFPRLAVKNKIPAIGLRLNDSLWRVILPFARDSNVELDTRIKNSIAALFPDSDYDMEWKSEFELHRRVCPSFVVGRIALAGDAAHLNSPVGGQGMNSGMQDAFCLHRALIEALHFNRPLALKYYDCTRRSGVTGKVNRFTGGLTRILLAGEGKYIHYIFYLTQQLIRVRYLRSKLLRSLSMLS